MAHTNGTKQTAQDLHALPSDCQTAPGASELTHALQQLRTTERLLLTFTATVLQSVEALMHNSWVRVDGDAIQMLASLRELARRVRERVQKPNGH